MSPMRVAFLLFIALGNLLGVLAFFGFGLAQGVEWFMAFKRFIQWTAAKIWL